MSGPIRYLGSIFPRMTIRTFRKTYCLYQEDDENDIYYTKMSRKHMFYDLSQEEECHNMDNTKKKSQKIRPKKKHRLDNDFGNKNEEEDYYLTKMSHLFSLKN
tara:strand:- start:157 stop:465 length:309 start_codon:yes stop_codon:yes gene_type:complete